MNLNSCPCGSNLESNVCCLPIIEGKKSAVTPEQLMRSRYSAFCLRKADYLIQSLHSSKRDINDSTTLSKTIDDTRWLGLKVVQSKLDAQNKNKAYVEFIAYWIPSANDLESIQTSDIQQLHEYSNFIKENNQWFYVDGDILPPVKLQRNDICWCGSGRKLKKCHQ